jgi:hypothetical protein
MIEPAVTVVRCRACRHSERLTLTDGRFWCAWCQRWAEIDAEQVLGAEVVPEGDHFRLAPVAKPEEWQQPLRIPSGWLISWNSFAEEDIDPTADYHSGTMNLFLATNEHIRRVIDVDWHAEPGPPVTARYRLRLLPLIAVPPEDRRRDSGPLGTDWDSPVHEFETELRLALVAELEACLRGERG